MRYVISEGLKEVRHAYTGEYAMAIKNQMLAQASGPVELAMYRPRQDGFGWVHVKTYTWTPDSYTK